MEVSGLLHAPAALPPGKDPLVPIEKLVRRTDSNEKPAVGERTLYNEQLHN
jgi:hypothetical protein